MTEQISWQGETIPIKRSRRKTLALHVKAGRAEIRAPGFVSESEIRDFLSSRYQWLEKTRQEQARRQAALPDYSQSATVPLMDRLLTLQIRSGQTRLGWELTDDTLLLQTSVVNRELVHHVLADFYKIQARRYLTEKTVECVSSQGWLDRLTDVRFRRTKTKWGHCTSAGRIQYNWLILQAPERIVDYLVAHECAHLLHPHHGPAFWAEVQRLHPGCKEDRSWLNAHGHRLHL